MKYKFIQRNNIHIVTIIFLLMLYGLYLWIWVNPSLYLIKEHREFFTNFYFFSSFLDFPGGLTEYLSRLFIQFYNFPLVASLLTSLCLTTTYLLWISIFGSQKKRYWIPLIPIFILMLMHNDYGHAVRFDLDLLALSTTLFLFSASTHSHKRMMYFSHPLLFAILLYINGLFAAITFTTASLLMLVPKKEKAACILVLLVETLIVFLLYHFLFYLSFHDLKQEFTDITRMYSFHYYPLLLYASVAMLPTLTLLTIPFLKIKKSVFTFALLGVLPLLFVVSDREERQNLLVQHYARNENWERVLITAQQCEYPDKNTVYYTNQALYHTGKIHNELFAYNQWFGSEGLLRAEMGTFSEIVPNQDIFLQLGALSLSIIWGTEATNVYGANPYVLRNLTKAYLAGGYIREAQKTLNLLDQSLFQKDWVKQYRKFVCDTTLIGTDPELGRLRKAQTPLAVVSKQRSLTNLSLLAQHSNLNKMAYDYLLVGTLLDHRMENFAFHISRLKEYGYKEIPKVYLEGLVYNTLYSDQLPLDIRDFTYDETVLFRFSAFQKDLLTLLQQDSDKTRDMLKSKYGDTYWYYLLFDSQLSEDERMNIFMKIIS